MLIQVGNVAAMPDIPDTVPARVRQRLNEIVQRVGSPR
jgi:hypothetical protein